MLVDEWRRVDRKQKRKAGTEQKSEKHRKVRAKMFREN